MGCAVLFSHVAGLAVLLCVYELGTVGLCLEVSVSVDAEQVE